MAAMGFGQRLSQVLGCQTGFQITPGHGAWYTHCLTFFYVIQYVVVTDVLDERGARAEYGLCLTLSRILVGRRKALNITLLPPLVSRTSALNLAHSIVSC